MAKQKIMYLDVARIIATIAVVFVHIASMEPNWSSYACNTSEWAVFCGYASMTKWAAPLFCLISGALFLDPDRNVTIKKLYTRNIPRILTGLAFWSTVYAVNLIVLYKTDFTTAAFIKKIVGGNYHQWYLYMIIGFYILVPVIRKITADKDLTKYLTAVAVIFNFVIPFFQLNKKLDWTTKATNQMFIELPGYLAFFLIGYYIHKFDLKKITKILLYCGGIAALALTVVGTVTKSAESGTFFRLYTNYNSITVLVQTVFIFVLIKDICNVINFNKRSEKSIGILSKDTFGIYQMHPLIIMWLTKFLACTSTSIMGIEMSPIIAIPLFLVLTYIICEVISHILNKIPVVNKYLV